MITYEEIVRALTPMLVAEIINASKPADTDLFSPDLQAPDNGFWIVQYITDTANYPKAKITPAGTITAITAGLNASKNVVINSWYEWLTATKKGDKLNIQISAAATITLRVFFAKSS